MSERNRQEALLSLLGRGGYLRIELRHPRAIPAARWTNYVWCLRAESDPGYISPPLLRTKVDILVFPMPPHTAGKVRELLTT